MSSGELRDVRKATALCSPAAHSATKGRWQWTHVGKQHIGVVNIHCKVSDVPDLRLQMVVHELRPSEPTLVFVCREGWARRLCVNAVHRPIDGTHKHRVTNVGDEPYAPDDIPTPPLSPDITVGMLYAVLSAFAAECHIQMSPGLDWAPPWEGA